MSTFAGTSTVSGSNDLIGAAAAGVFSGSNSLVGTVANPVYPLLSPLGNYGGPTQTLALLPGSPALNAYTTGAAPGTDQRGISRPANAMADLGAFQSQGFTLAITGGNNQVAVPGATFASPLQVTVISAFGEPVQGGVVTFTSPASGASAFLSSGPSGGGRPGVPPTNPGATLSTTTVPIGAAGAAAVTATANNLSGGYTVTAAANGATPTSVAFNLINNGPIPVIAGLPTSSPEGTAITVTASATDPIATETAAGFTYLWQATEPNGTSASEQSRPLSFNGTNQFVDLGNPADLDIRRADHAGKPGSISSRPLASRTS